MFPFSNSSPVYPYTMRIPKKAATGVVLTLEKLRELAEERFLVGRVPESLTFTDASIWGWCWWMDTPEPLDLGRWIVFGIRQWKKRPPASLISAMLDEKVAAAKADGIRTTKEWRTKAREEIERVVTSRTMPAVEEDPIAIDTQTGTIYLFSLSKSVRDSHLAKLRRILDPVYGNQIEFVPWSLFWLFNETRPSANLPEEYHYEFMEWVAKKAMNERFLTATLDNGDVMRLGLALDDSVRLEHSTGGDMAVTGEGAVLDSLGDLYEEEPTKRVSRLRLFITDKDGSDLRVLIDSSGGIRKCSVLEGGRYSKRVSNLDAACFERCEAYDRAALIIRVLMQAFDHGPLQEMLDTAPQRMLWPGAASGQFVWTNTDPNPDDIDTDTDTDTDTDENPNQLKLV